VLCSPFLADTLFPLYICLLLWLSLFSLSLNVVPQKASADDKCAAAEAMLCKAAGGPAVDRFKRAFRELEINLDPEFWRKRIVSQGDALAKFLIDPPSTGLQVLEAYAADGTNLLNYLAHALLASAYGLACYSLSPDGTWPRDERKALLHATAASEAGWALATLALAEKSDDPSCKRSLYEKAAAQGSVFARKGGLFVLRLCFMCGCVLFFCFLVFCFCFTIPTIG
jgi:hypothetical protein